MSDITQGFKPLPCRFTPSTFSEIQARAAFDGTSLAEQIRYLVEWGIEQGVFRPRKVSIKLTRTTKAMHVRDGLTCGESPKAVADRLGVSHDYVRQIRSSMIKAGMLSRMRKGKS